MGIARSGYSLRVEAGLRMRACSKAETLTPYVQLLCRERRESVLNPPPRVWGLGIPDPEI